MLICKFINAILRLSGSERKKKRIRSKSRICYEWNGMECNVMFIRMRVCMSQKRKHQRNAIKCAKSVQTLLMNRTFYQMTKHLEMSKGGQTKKKSESE